MSARRVTLALAVVALLLCLAPALSAQDSHARIVRLSFIDGQVQIDKNAGQGMEKAILNMPIVEGAKLRVDQDSHAEVEFEDGSTVRLVGPSQIAFPQLSLSDGKKNTQVRVDSGLAYFDVDKLKDNNFEVKVGSRTLAVHKDAEFRVDASDPQEKVAVMKGQLDLQGEPKEVAVKKGETITFTVDNPQYAVAHDVDKIGSDQWNKDREQDVNLVARSDQYHNTSNYYGGNYYGGYDLARYGNWYYGQGYGWLWRPYFYDASYAYDPTAWDPFSNGAWSFYPGAGWTFISGYPWGWAPYRYGSWMFVPGFGWSWRPTAPSYAWQAVPPVLNAPAGYTIPRPPVKAGGGTVAVNPGAVNGLTAAPRPARTAPGAVVVPTRPVVMSGALNADKRINSRAIAPGENVRVNPRAMTGLTRAEMQAQQTARAASMAPNSGASQAGAPAQRPGASRADSHASPRPSAPRMSAPPRMSSPPPMRAPSSSGVSRPTPHR